jgi:hypothetical protein
MSPISKENRRRYPKNWKTIRKHIMERAGNRCECVGECGQDHAAMRGFRSHKASRCDEHHGFKALHFSGGVVLTVAHLDHTPENNTDDNLMAMCQKCHNRLDAAHRAANAANTRRKKANVGQLELGIET